MVGKSRSLSEIFRQFEVDFSKNTQKIPKKLTKCIIFTFFYDLFFYFSIFLLQNYEKLPKILISISTIYSRNTIFQ